MGGLKLTAAEFFRIAKALADPRRCEILETIAPEGESCCGHLVSKLPVAQATVSHHLKELATAGLLKVRREGQFSYYKFCPEVLKAYLVELELRYRCCADASEDHE